MRVSALALCLLATPAAALTCQDAWNYSSCFAPFMRIDPTNNAVGAQIDAACSALTKPNMVVVPPGSPLGDSLTGLPNGCLLLDYRTRGLDIFGNSAGGMVNGSTMQARSVNAAPGTDINTAQIAMTAWTGGSNKTGGPKTNYSALWATMVGHTSGQTNAYSFSNLHFSNGDTIGLDGVAQSWGRNNAGGDEGTEALTLGASQGDRVFTGRVTALAPGLSASTQISYNTPVNENTRGEDRPIIITTPGRAYSVGNVVAVSGAPPVVTGDGTQDFTTLAPVGPVSNLFMSLDTQTSTFNALKMVVPVRSITDATHLVLDYVSEGNDAPLPVPTLPSTYKIFLGGNLTGMPVVSVGGDVLPVLGVMFVTPAADFAVGDTFEEPLGYAHTIKGAQFYIKQYLPFSSNAGGTGIAIGSLGTQVVPTGYGLIGPFSSGFYATDIRTDGLLVLNNPPGALVKSGFTGGGVTNLLGSYTGAGQNTFLSYDRTVDVWKTGKPISAPNFECNGVVGATCNGAPTAAFAVRCGLIVTC